MRDLFLSVSSSGFNQMKRNKLIRLKRAANPKNKNEPFIRFLFPSSSGKAAIEIALSAVKKTAETPHPILQNSTFSSG